MAETSPLFLLPAELRLQIYTHALSPTGSLYLHTTTTKRHACTPSVNPSLLLTCRQIHHEAAGILYLENTVTFTVDAHDTTWPTISEKRLPQHVLEKLVHVCVLLDCTGPFQAGYGDVDFGAFGALTSLKTLRLRHLGVANEVLRQDLDFVPLVREILERVPRSTKVVYGPEEGDDGVAMFPLNARMAQPVVTEGRIPMAEVIRDRERRVRLEVRETTVSEWKDAMEDFVVEQGVRSGGVRDVWATYREAYQYSEARVVPGGA